MKVGDTLIPILRKCKYCDSKKDRTINVDTDKYIYYSNNFYHYDCFAKALTEKNKYTPEKIKNLTEAQFKKTLTNQSVQQNIDKDRLFYWLYDNYNIKVLPNYVYTKIASIADGTFSKRVIAPISYFDLLCIFKKMKKTLDKEYMKNKQKGKEFDAVSRINYDLAIVINNYDKYLEWKERNRDRNIQKKEVASDIKSMRQSGVPTKEKNKETNEKMINISDIIDDCF